jgi:DNA-binding beta-propeller fold protein YncE
MRELWESLTVEVNQMKLLSIRLAGLAVVFLFAFQLHAQNANNPIQIALLRWYSADTVAQLGTCGGPAGMAFDGFHMWVACSGSFQLDEFDASDGSVVPVNLSHSYGEPYYLLYDGANIWVTNPTSNTVTKVQASSPTTQTVITVGTTPTGMAFDGAYVWVANSGSNSVSKILATTGAVTTYSLSSSCTNPLSMAFDSYTANIWVVCNAAPNGPYVAELNSTGSVVYHTATFGSSPYSNNLIFDGTYLWPANETSNSIIQINTQTLVKQTLFLGSGLSPVAVAFDGKYIWVANAGSSTITQLLSSAGSGPITIVGSSCVVTGCPGSAPNFLAFDGGYVWVANGAPIGGGGYFVSKM